MVLSEPNSPVVAESMMHVRSDSMSSIGSLDSSFSNGVESVASSFDSSVSSESLSDESVCISSTTIAVEPSLSNQNKPVCNNLISGTIVYHGEREDSDWFGVPEDKTTVVPNGFLPFQGGVPNVKFRATDTPVVLPALPEGTPNVVINSFPNGCPGLPNISLSGLPPVVPATLNSMRPVLACKSKASIMEMENSTGLGGVVFGAKAPLQQSLNSNLSKQEHLDQGMWIESPYDKVVQLPAYLEEVLAIQNAWTEGQVHAYRLAMLNHVKEYASSPQHKAALEVWNKSRPHHAHSINPQFDAPLFLHLVKLNGLDPSLWGFDLHSGFPLTGEIGNYGVWEEADNPPATPISEVTSTSKERFAKMCANVLKQSEDQVKGTWVSHTKEEKLGFVRGPFWVDGSRGPDCPDIFQAEGFDWESANWVPRKSIPHNSEAGEFRCIDDGRIAALNIMARIMSNAWLPTLDMFACFLSRLMSMGSDVVAFKGDHWKAYKTWPARAKDRFLSILLVVERASSNQSGESGKSCEPDRVSAWVHDSLMFGSVGSVWAYCPLSLTLAVMLGRLWLVGMVAYVDDYLGGEKSSSGGLGFFLFLEVHRLLGIVLKPEKQKGPSVALAGLGMRILLRRSEIVIAPSSARRNKVSGVLSRFIKDRVVDRSSAKQAAGQASFLAGGLWGRVGRIALHCLWSFTAYGASKRVFGNQLVSFEVLKALIEKCPPRMVEPRMFEKRKRAVAWIDGAWRPEEGIGGIGIILVLFDDQDRVQYKAVVSCGVPSKLIARWNAIKSPKHLISQIESCAASLLLSTFEDELRGRSLTIFEDHRGCHSGLLRGVAKSVLSAELSLSYWWGCLTGDVVSWIERVPSGSNPADDPSKKDLRRALAWGCQVREPVWARWLMNGPEVLLKEIHMYAEKFPEIDLQEKEDD